MKDIKEIIKLSDKIKDLLAKAKRVVPYNLNVIDELHANENAHSRILCKLLQYQDVDGNYRVLNSFIRYISQSKPAFADIVLTHPNITQEKERIDLWIRDEKFAIILENKVCGASDQNKQLERYINKTKRVNPLYKDEQIFIIYLPADDHDPSEQSWGAYKSDCIIRTENYAKVSFKDVILPWLKTEVLPFCTLRESILSSAIKQYVDYLEGIFGLRTSQQNLYKMKPEWLQELGLNGDFATNLKQINEWLGNLSKAQHLLTQYRNENVDEFMKRFVAQSVQVLRDCYRSEWGNRGNIYQGWYFFYNKEWCTDSFVHIEWSEVKIDDLFCGERLEYVIKLHVEGKWTTKKEYINILQDNLGTFFNRSSKTTFWLGIIHADKPIGMMSNDELYEFLRKVYTTGDIKEIIQAVTKTSCEYEETYNNPKNQ